MNLCSSLWPWWRKPSVIRVPSLASKIKGEGQIPRIESYKRLRPQALKKGWPVGSSEEPRGPLRGEEGNKRGSAKTHAFLGGYLGGRTHRLFLAFQVGEYDGSFDLKDHLCYFENVTLLHWYIDKVKY